MPTIPPLAGLRGTLRSEGKSLRQGFNQRLLPVALGFESCGLLRLVQDALDHVHDAETWRRALKHFFGHGFKQLRVEDHFLPLGCWFVRCNAHAIRASVYECFAGPVLPHFEHLTQLQRSRSVLTSIVRCVQRFLVAIWNPHIPAKAGSFEA